MGSQVWGEGGRVIMLAFVLIGVFAVGLSVPLSQDQRVAGRVKRGGHGFRISDHTGRQTRSAQEDTEVAEQTSEKDTETSLDKAVDYQFILELAGATPQEVDRSGPPSYTAGRRKRGTGLDNRIQSNAHQYGMVEEVPAESSEKPDVIPQVQPRPVVQSGSSYGRRRKRSGSVSESAAESSGQSTESLPTESSEKPYVLPKGKYGDLKKFLRLAGAKPQRVVPGGGGSYGRRRKRSGSVSESAAESSGQSTESPITSKPSFDFASRILAIAGAGPTKVVPNEGYGRRRRRSNEDILTNEIPSGVLPVKNIVVQKEGDLPVAAVKVKSHGTNGLRSYDEWSRPNDGVFRGRYSGYGRRRRNVVSTVDFIPFSEYETRRVGTLKVEQNDFLALDKRLQAEQEDGSFRSDINVRARKGRQFPLDALQAVKQSNN